MSAYPAQAGKTSGVPAASATIPVDQRIQSANGAPPMVSLGREAFPSVSSRLWAPRHCLPWRMSQPHRTPQSDHHVPAGYGDHLARC